MLETVEQHNQRIIEERTQAVEPENPTGVACPMCGNELSWWRPENNLLLIGANSYERRGDTELWYLPAVCNRCGHRMNLLIE